MGPYALSFLSRETHRVDGKVHHRSTFGIWGDVEFGGDMGMVDGDGDGDVGSDLQ